MEEALVTRERVTPAELVLSRPQEAQEDEVVGSEESVLIRGLMQRVTAFGRANRQVVPVTSASASPEQGYDLQDMLNQVAAQVPDD